MTFTHSTHIAKVTLPTNRQYDNKHCKFTCRLPFKRRTSAFSSLFRNKLKLVSKKTKAALSQSKLESIEKSSVCRPPKENNHFTTTFDSEDVTPSSPTLCCDMKEESI